MSSLLHRQTHDRLKPSGRITLNRQDLPCIYLDHLGLASVIVLGSGTFFLELLLSNVYSQVLGILGAACTLFRLAWQKRMAPSVASAHQALSCQCTLS